MVPSSLEPKTVADFYAEVMRTLDDLGLTTSIWPMPVEIQGDVIPFDMDTVHASYDAAAVHRFSQLLGQIDRVFQAFRARFVGKASPVHFFWGGFDLAVTRFSGRSRAVVPARSAPLRAARDARGVLTRGQQLRLLADGGTEGLFYSYAYPEPDGFKDAPMSPGAVVRRATGRVRAAV